MNRKDHWMLDKFGKERKKHCISRRGVYIFYDTIERVTSNHDQIVFKDNVKGIVARAFLSRIKIVKGNIGD